ncbi:MAG: NADP-dependent phosphogluconate dehydrogenase [Alphaproteobacteria bacterium]|nr:NADP-dependent phosphogluconate dehydrogenase [Alphaproteobacteria bacterium]
MAEADVGLIGLGVMGANLALNIAQNGFKIAVYNRTGAKTDAFYADAGDLRDKIVPCATMDELVEAIGPPRPVIIMVQAGEAVDAQILALRERMAPGDIIIDAGNANFHDTKRRFSELGPTGLEFVGMGVSGGEEGARYGPSIMVGGTRSSYDRIEPMLTAISAKYEGEPCSAWLGNDGAGHFVKTIHNGIEYADMQMIAEVYGVLRDGLGLSPGEIAKIFDRWNAGRLKSFLVEITASVLAVTDEKTGTPLIDLIVDRAGQKGTGRWSVIEAQMLGVPATGIEAAVAARALSSMLDQRRAAEDLYGKSAYDLGDIDAAALIDDLELALFGSKIAAYAQGFAVMRAASAEFRWDLPMGLIASIWRAGCIIRSQFLGAITEAYKAQPDLPNLLIAPEFVALMDQTNSPLRRVVSKCVLAGLPMPAMSAALAYFDGYRQARGTANLIQAQRDFFGAHSFERTDMPGTHNGPWAGVD